MKSRRPHHAEHQRDKTQGEKVDSHAGNQLAPSQRCTDKPEQQTHRCTRRHTGKKTDRGTAARLSTQRSSERTQQENTFQANIKKSR